MAGMSGCLRPLVFIQISHSGTNTHKHKEEKHQKHNIKIYLNRKPPRVLAYTDPNHLIYINDM